MARPTNHDKRINDLLGQLRRALVAKEQARIEASVEAQMAGLVAGLGNGAAVVASPTAAPAAPAAASRRKGWSAAAKQKARLRMQKYWAAKRAKEGKRGKGAATPAQPRDS